MDLLGLMGLGALAPWQSFVDSAESANIVAYAAAKTVGGVVSDPMSRANILSGSLSSTGPQFSAAAYSDAAAKQRMAADAWYKVAARVSAEVAAAAPFPAKLTEVTAMGSAQMQADADHWYKGYIAYAEQLERAAKLSAAKASTGENVGPTDSSCPTGYVQANGICVPAGSVNPGGTTDPMELNCRNIGGIWDGQTCLTGSGDSGSDPFPLAKKFPTALVVGGLAAAAVVGFFLLRKRSSVAGLGCAFGRCHGLRGLGFQLTEENWDDADMAQNFDGPPEVWRERRPRKRRSRAEAEIARDIAMEAGRVERREFEAERGFQTPVAQKRAMQRARDTRAWWLPAKPDERALYGLGHGGYLDARGGHFIGGARAAITAGRAACGSATTCGGSYHWHRPSGWRTR